ncbi:hypothetical protein JCM11641_006385 [Rhodosporidiobolus odoratus]
MFAKQKPLNPYDEVITKATDEKQTEINWEIALTVWDKVNEDGEQGARNCVTALQKRLNHRSANVQLFSLTLAGALVNNCGAALHREVSGKVFTQTLVRLINDRTTHETVKNSALSTIETWVKDHPSDPNFDLLLDTYESLKRQGQVFPSTAPPRQATPQGPSHEQLRREEEELQRALEESAKLADPMRGYKRSSPPADYRKNLPHEPHSAQSHGPNGRDDGFIPPSSSSAIPDPTPKPPSRVRALYDFVGQTADELQMKRGEEVRVLEEISEDWMRGESERTGRRGIFPTNYVETLPDLPQAAGGHSHNPSRSQSFAHQPAQQQQQQQQQQLQPPQSEEEAEAEVFAQAAAIDRLLNLMGQVRARGEDFADNEEVTDLYNTSMRLRPRVVQLIRKYEQKQADLQGLSDNLTRAKAAYEQTMSLPPSHAYGHAQPNGDHPHQQQPPPHHAASPSPAPQVVPYGAAPPQQQQQQQQQPDPAQAQRDFEEEQRREYERKYAEYERQLEEYNRQMAQMGQQQQPPAPSGTPQQDPHSQPPAQANVQPYYSQFTDPSQPPSHPPPGPTASPAPAPSSTPAPDPAQPVWDGQAWVWPAQHASPLPEHHAPPAPAMSPVPVPAANGGYPAQTQPYEHPPPPGQVGSPAPHAHPHAHAHVQQQQVYGATPSQGYPLVDQMANLSMSSAANPGSPPPPAIPVVGSPAPHLQQQQAYYHHQQQHQQHQAHPSLQAQAQAGHVEPYQSAAQPGQSGAAAAAAAAAGATQAQDPQAAAWAAWHAAQAQAQQQGYGGGPGSLGGR